MVDRLNQHIEWITDENGTVTGYRRGHQDHVDLLTNGSLVSNNIASKAAMLDADKRLQTAANIGAVVTAATTTAVEYGDGYHHTTKLTLTAFAVGNSADNASKALGAGLYTLPAGAIIVDSAYLSVGLTLADAVQTDTPEIGLGTTVGSGVNATLGAVGAAAENIWEGAATADVAGTAKVGTKLPTAAVPLIIESGGDHTIYLNVADGWANLTAASAITATGTVVLNWRFVN